MSQNGFKCLLRLDSSTGSEWNVVVERTVFLPFVLVERMELAWFSDDTCIKVNSVLYDFDESSFRVYCSDSDGFIHETDAEAIESARYLQNHGWTIIPGDSDCRLFKRLSELKLEAPTAKSE